MNTRAITLTALAIGLVVCLGGWTVHVAQSTGDAPEISRSVGEAGGVIVFWPRVIPSSASSESVALAGALQAKLRELVERALPGRSIDMRPEPERVCPQAGCNAMTVGVLLARREEGCVAVALISGSGRSTTQLIRWAGGVRINTAEIAFRDPPESHITVTDYSRCDELQAQTAEADEAIVAAIRRVASENPASGR